MKQGISFIWAYVSILIFAPLYRFFAAKPFLELLGLNQHGCTGKNELGLSSSCIIDTHFIVLMVFTLAMTIWSFFLSKDCQTKKDKVLYRLSVFVFNAGFSVLILMMVPREG